MPLPLSVAAGTAQRDTSKAKKWGASDAEIAEGLMIAALISSGTELHWMLDDYEALLGKKSSSGRWFEEVTDTMGEHLIEKPRSWSP